MTMWGMRIACWVPKATNTHTHTLRLCNTDCFSTATVVARTPLNVTLYVHCLSCLVSEQLSMTLHPNVTIILLSVLFPSVSPHEYAWQFIVASCFSLGQLWRSVLLGRWSITTFCVSCSCMAWQPFSWSVYGASRTSRMISVWCIFVHFVQRGSLPIETENRRWTGRTNSDTFATVSRYVVRKSVESVSSGLQKRVQKSGACVEI